ncbi:hypothetical protein [Tsukamurella pseudospumae]|uniref:SHOCT domain-containing protein n=1 Tax=Tsukamurella pseudospumae TaxID=239498 RepID=A0A138AK06_9ACTN|nr:hypothetical protein [Tsukamurella pseudospumae]KXO90540.1 hypothetical protein AXK61_07970 [Tsukamurella pseudospumae]KXP10803.1 hypothetical protein AXK60_05845 [Tsukamurella pseudospumae]
MGLFSSGPRDTAGLIPGSVTVVGVPVDAEDARGYMGRSVHVAVSAPGIGPFYRKARASMLKSDRYPEVGMTVPAWLDPQTHEPVRIEWEIVPTRDESARAAFLYCTGSPEAPPPGTLPDGTPSPLSPSTIGAFAAPPHPVDRLTALASLLDRGLISREQFGALRDRVLRETGP